VQDQSTDATSYGWYINGHPYATHADTSFYAATAGSYTVTEYAYNSLCEDSSIRKIIVEDTIHHTAILDTSICSPISLVLNSHLPNTLWSNGTADSVTTVTGPGLYRAIASNICGTIIDSVNVSTKPAIAGFDLTDSKSSICEGDNDSSTVTASIDSGQSVVFIWSTGLRDTTIYSSHIAVYQTGTYEVTADNGFCPQMKTISITEAACDSECVHGFAIPDIFSPNNDGRNDTFLIPHLCDMTPFAMHIYNRWGQLVFESTDINVGWDGKYKGALEPEEEYWLWLMMTLPNGKHIYRSGTVTLVR
jgi:gliding motility-associated-like protein